MTTDEEAWKRAAVERAWDEVDEGYRIELVTMPNDPDPIPTGTRGQVTHIVEYGGERRQLWVDWDPGVEGIKRSLCLVPGDEFRVLHITEVQEEDQLRAITVNLEYERDRIRDTKQFFPPRPRTREERATIMGSHLWERR